MWTVIGLLLLMLALVLRWSRSRPHERGFHSRGEQECRRVLAKLFPGEQFDKVRPAWQLNDYPGRKHAARCLELDLYNERRKLAVEYNGAQHYRMVPRFHLKRAERRLPVEDQRLLMAKRLRAQQARDAQKQRNCVKAGVDLVVVSCDDARPISDILAHAPAIAKHLQSR